MSLRLLGWSAPLLLVGACATAPPPATAPALACPERLSPEESMLLNHRHRELIKALASGQREAARAFYGERAIIAGPEIVGPFESIMVNRVDNPHGAFLSLPTPIHGYKAYGSSRCNVEVTSGNYTSSPDGGGLRLPFTIVWIKVDGEWKVLFHHIEAPR